MSLVDARREELNYAKLMNEHCVHMAADITCSAVSHLYGYATDDCSSAHSALLLQQLRKNIVLRLLPIVSIIPHEYSRRCAAESLLDIDWLSLTLVYIITHEY